MSQVIVGILALIAMGLVAYPLFQVKEEVDDVDGQEEDAELEDVLLRREGVYSAIKELDQDYQMGNLSEQDYRELRDSYKLKAAMVLKQIDEMVPVVQHDVEEPVDRATGTAAAGRGVAASSRKRAAARFCSACGAKLSACDRFCAGCGRPLASGCPRCGREFEPGDSFCATCGASLKGGKRA
ncbi:MAG: zinc ribbon domain-containing protein [Chloroflexi bacterium]|nr:zinc ribbon domain-containing protein [Chloroflexota bacterium]